MRSNKARSAADSGLSSPDFTSFHSIFSSLGFISNAGGRQTPLPPGSNLPAGTEPTSTPASDPPAKFRPPSPTPPHTSEGQFCDRNSRSRYHTYQGTSGENARKNRGKKWRRSGDKSGKHFAFEACRMQNTPVFSGRNAGWSSPGARQAHNLKVAGSNLALQPIYSRDSAEGGVILLQTPRPCLA